jgi:hypothetical protein
LSALTGPLLVDGVAGDVEDAAQHAFGRRARRSGAPVSTTSMAAR